MAAKPNASTAVPGIDIPAPWQKSRIGKCVTYRVYRQGRANRL